MPANSLLKISLLAMSKSKGKVGRKGELFPHKEIREEAGLRPGDRLTYEAHKGRIEAERVPTLRDAFSQKKSVKVSFKQFEAMTDEIFSLSGESASQNPLRKRRMGLRITAGSTRHMAGVFLPRMNCESLPICLTCRWTSTTRNLPLLLQLSWLRWCNQNAH